MRFPITVVATCCAPLLAGLCFVGCANQQPTDQSHPTTHPATMASEQQPQAYDDARKLQQHVAQLADISRGLPGDGAHPALEHRQLMSRAFGEISAILPLVQGTVTGGQYRQQLRIVASAHEQLTQPTSGMSDEPTIDSGLRATYGALSEVAAADYAGVDTIKKPLDDLKKGLDDLDRYQGPFHRYTVAQCVDRIVQTTQAISETMASRVGVPESETPAGMPATSAPTTRPASASR